MESTTTSNAFKEVFEVAHNPSFFNHSTPGSYSYTWEQSTIYSRIESSAILGEPPIVSEDTDNLASRQDISRCFNCGNPDHKVPTCPLPANHKLIALSRQYYQFFHGNAGPQWKRIHTFESHRQQRLNWLEEFQPGDIKGNLLQTAIEQNNEEWLSNISDWGYPPGWTSDVDPRERVRARIWTEYDHENYSVEAFEIHGEDEVEAISIIGNNTEEIPDDRNVVLDNPDEALAGGQRLAKHSNSDTVDNAKRWATYPNRYFSSDLLFMYTPPAPRLLSPLWDDTSFSDTAAYLYQHYARPPSPPGSPPPLPPPPVPPLSPELHSHYQDSLAEPESDMEMSDSE